MRHAPWRRAAKSQLLALQDGDPTDVTSVSGELAARSIGTSYGEESEAQGGYISDLMGHSLDGTGLSFASFSFGAYLSATAFWPSSMQRAASKLQPAVVWLHPYSYNTGYTPSYRQSRIHLQLASAGFVVVAYDQVGFGIRNTQGGNRFYARHGGNASLLGQMGKDTRAAVDWLLCRSTACSSARCLDSQGGQPDIVPYVDPERIYLMGYSLGGNVALHAAALDARVAGVGAIAAFTPFRTDAEGRPTGGLRWLYEMHALLPRLGLFAATPGQVPYDYDDLLREIAPRPTLLCTPKGDRDATFTDVQACVDAASHAQLTQISPGEITKMEEAETHVLVGWLNRVARVDGKLDGSGSSDVRPLGSAVGLRRAARLDT